MSICLLVYVSLTLVCLSLCVSVGLYVCLPVRLSVGWLMVSRVKVDRLVSLYCELSYAGRSVGHSVHTNRKLRQTRLTGNHD